MPGFKTMEFVQVASVAIELAQELKEICDNVESNKDKCGLLGKVSIEVGALLQRHFGDSQEAAQWEQDKSMFAKVDTVRFCLKNAADLIRSYLGTQMFEKPRLILNVMNIDPKFQKVIGNLKDAERQLVQVVSVDVAANQGDNSEVAANQGYMQEFLQAAERDRQRDITALQEELEAHGRNDEAVRQLRKVVIELLTKQSAVSFNSSSSASSFSTRISVAAGESNADFAYFIPPNCIEYEVSSMNPADDNRVIVGRGTFGAVYKAKLHQSLPVAVKVLEVLATNKDALGRLKEEIRIMACLSHPNIICVLGVHCPSIQPAKYEDREKVSLVMELAENKSLAYHLGMLQDGDVQQSSQSIRIKILSGLADGLYYLQMQGIVHGKIKPDNVLLDQDFGAKLSDWGLAKVKPSSVSPNRKAGFVGTHGYQSADMMDMVEPSFPADIWAFGVIMVECMIGKRLFHGYNPQQIMNMVCSDTLPMSEMKQVESHWPKEYYELAKKCLSWNPAKRPTAMDISVVMHGIIAHPVSTSRYISGIGNLTLDDDSNSLDPGLAGLSMNKESMSPASSVTITTHAETRARATLAEQIEDWFTRGENLFGGKNGFKFDQIRAAEYYGRAADQGHAGAQCRLGVCYENGLGVVHDPKQAVEWYQLAANQGHDQARFNLGVCYHCGWGVSRNSMQAVKWYLLAANERHANAQYFLGRCYDVGYGVVASRAEAEKWYQLAADQGHRAAKQALSPPVPYVVERLSSERSSAASKLFRMQFRSVSPKEEPETAFRRGEDLYYGLNGSGINFARAVECFRQAAHHRHADAQYMIGACYYSGQGVEQDCEKAVRWYRLAADRGHANAQCNLGVCYYSGHGVEQDYQRAVEWYRLAAEQGHANAQCNLGVCYFTGRGIARDYREAVPWYWLAAHQGYANAQCNLGVCFYNGQGVIQDYQKAVEWCRLAAEQGLARAQLNLGIYYYNGQGVAQDMSEAKKWYQLAADQGDDRAKVALSNMN